MTGLIEGLTIFSKYGYIHVSAEHDIIYAGGKVTTKHRRLLRELGWIWYEELDSWGYTV